MEGVGWRQAREEGGMLRTGVCRQEGGAAKGREGRGESESWGANTGDILCVPQDLRQRGVAVIRPGEGRKLAGLGERGKHTKGWQRQQQRGGSEGGLCSSRAAGRGRGQGTKGQQERRWGGAGRRGGGGVPLLPGQE